MTKQELISNYTLGRVRPELKGKKKSMFSIILSSLHKVQVKCKATMEIKAGIYGDDFEFRVFYCNPYLRDKDNDILYKTWILNSNEGMSKFHDIINDIDEFITLTNEVENELRWNRLKSLCL